MEQQQLITKVTRVFDREDGSQARIIAEQFTGLGLNHSVNVMVHFRSSGTSIWKLCNDRPHSNWKEMSVEEYCRSGRSEMLQTVTPAEILKVSSMIGPPLQL